jgi:AcrR family transcriptional regulator
MGEAASMQALRQQARTRAREAVIDAADRLLAAEGAGALSLRRVAASVGASTQVIATHFDDKQGLLDALFARGFDALTAAMDDLPDGARVGAAMRAYRAFALDEPHRYQLMFARPVSDYAPGEAAKAAARGALEALVDVVRATRRAGAPTDPASSEADLADAHFVWSVAHGQVALELAGFVSLATGVDELFDVAVARVEQALRRRTGAANHAQSSG